jgi:hypothetical protein
MSKLKRVKPVYINVYDIERVYGGPEEGGWWYNTGDPVLSVRLDPKNGYESREELLRRARVIERWLKHTYPTTNRRFSVLGGEDYDIEIEDHTGRYFPQRRPRYE